MIIKSIAVGNQIEAYIEKLLSNNINIITSDDNNKGKTIIIQSIMYCLGNQPVFPSTFEYKKYYYYLEFSHNNCDYYMCRKGDTFIIFHEQNLMIFNSVSEMKRYWAKTIFPLPKIIKNDISRIVDPELFVQLFFIGQDKKDTSNISNKGFYTNDDFLNMIFSYANLSATGLTQEEIHQKKARIRDLLEEKRILQKQHKLLKSKNISSAYLSQFSDRLLLEAKIKSIEKTKNTISTLRSSRHSTINRKLKYEVTLKELHSLNRAMDSSELSCLDCGSNHIGLAIEANTSNTFDVSTPEIRKQIIDSIKENISAYEEEIERVTLEINKAQEQLRLFLEDDDISLESIVIHKQSILDSTGVESRLLEINDEISILSDAIKANAAISLEQIDKQKALLSEILIEMHSAYKRVDPSGTLVFDGLFTKRDQVFSGSEATEFHLIKLYALAAILKHPCPIIVDSFRAEDLSTERESTVIDLFSSLNRQIIFTTTLKNEELSKYQGMKKINNIDYSKNTPSKILNENTVSEFIGLIKRLSINI